MTNDPAKTTIIPALNWQAKGQWRDIEYHVAEGIAKITINRPEKRNAFRPQTVAELIQAFDLARDDNEVGVVILTGKGDLAFWYHSNEGMEIVGIAKVVKEHYQDPTTDETAWLAVDFAPHKKLAKPVTLAQIKSNKKLANMALVKLGRLSVQPVTEAEWEEVMLMSSK